MTNSRSLALAVLAASIGLSAHASTYWVKDEATLHSALAAATDDGVASTIKFKHKAHIKLHSPAIYSGNEAITVLGNHAVIDGSSAGSFDIIVDDEGFEAAVTEDGTLIFSTAAPVTIKKLTVKDSATRGIVVNVPESATGDDVEVVLRKVSVLDSALFGLHIDDNVDEFDDGDAGSAVGIHLDISRSSFTGNGTGALDFDGLRVDERGEGDIFSDIRSTAIDGNGGDGIELDEAGEGSVISFMTRVTLNGNGFYNEDDLDDGFDIDEAGAGDIFATLNHVEVSDNKDEGLDFDEEDAGDVNLSIHRVYGENNEDEAIKADEEDGGDIRFSITKTSVSKSGDDGVQFTELGEGLIKGYFNKVSVAESDKYGIKAEQWIEEDEDVIAEPAGTLVARKVTLSDNDDGDEFELNNIGLK